MDTDSDEYIATIGQVYIEGWRDALDNVPWANYYEDLSLMDEYTRGYRAGKVYKRTSM